MCCDGIPVVQVRDSGRLRGCHRRQQVEPVVLRRLLLVRSARHPQREIAVGATT